MTLIDEELTLFFSSDPELGATNVRENGSIFSVKLKNPITLPTTARYITLEVATANIWFLDLNIKDTYLNNKLHFSYDGFDFTIVVPNGLYNIDTLSTTIQKALTQTTFPAGSTAGFIIPVNGKFPADTIALFGNASTQKVEAQVLQGITLDFDNPDNNIGSIIGFDNGLYSSLYNYQIFTAPSPAKLNRINSYVIKCAEIGDGIPVNNISDGAICTIPLTAEPGNLITFEKYNPSRVQVSNINKLQDFTFRLTSESNKVIDTVNEYYNFSVVIRYKVSIDDVNSHATRNKSNSYL